MTDKACSSLILNSDMMAVFVIYVVKIAIQDLLGTWEAKLMK